jgi:Domain of unknown function DUF29
MNDLYDEDILRWSEHQSALLRRIASGEPLNETPDWSNIVEEVESVGREQLHAVESLLLQALVHMLEAEGWPSALDVDNWRGDSRGFIAQARRRFAPSMRQKIDLPGIYADALKALPERMDGHPPQSLPDACPMTLDALLGD